MKKLNENLLLKELVRNCVLEAIEPSYKEPLLTTEGVYDFIRRWFKPTRQKREITDATQINKEISRTARNLYTALGRVRYTEQTDDDVYRRYIIPLVRQIERIYGLGEPSELDEQTVGGVEPIPVGKAYFDKERIMQLVQSIILDKAPQGVTSQGEYIEILEQALSVANDKLKAEVGEDIEKMADYQLTLSMIERTLKQVPGDIFFMAMNKNS